ncbi:MAG: hypothetical protein AAFR21_11530 [Pseudomonadota bacterium]
MEKLAETILDLDWGELDDFALAIFETLMKVDSSISAGCDAGDVARAINEWAYEKSK